MLLFRLFGLFLLRLAERALSWLLFHDPPRSTRVKSTGGPTGSAADRFTLGHPATLPPAQIKPEPALTRRLAPRDAALSVVRTQ